MEKITESTYSALPVKTSPRYRTFGPARGRTEFRCWLCGKSSSFAPSFAPCGLRWRAGALAGLWPAAASAQGRLEAHYRVTLAGIQIGKGDWTIEIADTHYSASVNGTTTGLMHVLTEGEGSTVARGTLAAGKVQSSTYVAIVKSRKKKDEVRVTLDKGSVKDTSSDPPPDHDRERVPVTEADLQNVFDPMSASLLTVPATATRSRRRPASARCLFSMAVCATICSWPSSAWTM